MINNLHRHSIRLQDHDYTSPGAYFITLVAHQRELLFGELMEEAVNKSEIGKIVIHEWERLPKRFPNIKMDEFILMPNHFHGIIFINSMKDEPDQFSDKDQIERYGNPIHSSIGTIIRSYKGSATNQVHLWVKDSPVKIWQRNYYERIIRNEKELDIIRNYIVNNPENWEKDQDNVCQV
jgi:putative transposase